MSKDAINQYDATAANNTDVGGISIDEGMLPSNVNNALREIMSHLKDVDAGTSSLTSPVISGDLTVDTDTLFVDASADAVGIGTTSPSSFFSGADQLVVSGGSGDGGITIDAGTSSASRIHFADGTSGSEAYRGYVVYNHSNDSLQIATSGSEAMRILSGGGLTFNGDTSTDNALDDYEIGSWTPTYSISGGSFNMSLQLGTYVKVGEIVTATARVRGQRVGGSGTLTVTGLPYSTRNIANVHAAISIGYTNGWATSPQAGFTATNGTTISFKKNGSSSANSNLVDDITQADVNTSSTSNNDIIFSVTYVAN